jgi:ABC-type transport system substrate-binding protein
MKRIARATIAIAAAVVMAPVVVSAEPMMLTVRQMDAITAAAQLPEININVNVQSINTTQIANAFALSFATCGVCNDGAPSASSFASAGNFAVGAQSQQ